MMTAMPGLEGKVALVTGASSGIGQATALAFARAGARVAAHGPTLDELEETMALLRDAGAEAAAFGADVTDRAAIDAMFRGVLERYGRIDCAHNNAGIPGLVAPLGDYPDEEYDRIIAVNLSAVFSCLKHEITAMLRTGGGAIVNTASVIGLVGIQSQAVYAASKHGVVGLTKGAALDYAKDGIRVNAVCPGLVETPIFDFLTGGDAAKAAEYATYEPVGRIGKPDEVAATVLWLCSDAASYVTGAAIPVDGGYQAQ